MRRWLCQCLASVLMIAALFGCAGTAWHWPLAPAPPSQPLVLLENPMFVPVADREFLWQQLVDTVDDYFKIEREERVRLVGGVLTEGRIETVPTTGATLLEPWRDDSTPGFERLHATLQSIRRRAVVRVVPTEGGYLLDVAVYKELEDLDRPEHASVGSATRRHDGALVRREQGPEAVPLTLGWIALGRDSSLEQELLAQMRARLTTPAAH